LGSPTNEKAQGIVEVMSQVYPFFKEHLETHGNNGNSTRKSSYTSSKICDALIYLMGKDVQRQILTELDDYRYYSLTVDSTPDMSRVDQLSVST
jgi:hypothetical protein